MENSTEHLNDDTKEPGLIEKSQEPAPIELDQAKLDRYLDTVKLQQNLTFGLFAGLLAALVGAIAWAALTVATGYQIGYMAIAVGFIVGYSIKFAGRGVDKIYGIMGAVFALFGCLLGNFLSIIGFVANAEGVGFFQVLTLLDYSYLPEIMMETFSPIDLLFYGIALYEGYKFSFRNITEEELIENAAD